MIRGNFKQVAGDIELSALALCLLQRMAESLLVSIFKDSKLRATLENRTALNRQDIRLAKRLLGLRELGFLEVKQDN